MVWLAGCVEITGGWCTVSFAPGEVVVDTLLPSVLVTAQSYMPASAAGTVAVAPAGTVRLAGCEVIAGPGAEAAQAERISEKRGARYRTRPGCSRVRFAVQRWAWGALTVDDIVADSLAPGAPGKELPPSIASAMPVLLVGAWMTAFP